MRNPSTLTGRLGFFRTDMGGLRTGKFLSGYAGKAREDGTQMTILHFLAGLIEQNSILNNALLARGLEWRDRFIAIEV
jgi:hypothetical protein